MTEEEAEKKYKLSKYDYIIGSELDLYNQEVYDELMTWAKWYEDVTGVDGFRFQEAEKVPGWFIRDFAEAASNAGEEEKEIGLHFIYDKSERENITDKELQAVLKDNGII